MADWVVPLVTTVIGAGGVFAACVLHQVVSAACVARPSFGWPRSSSGRTRETTRSDLSKQQLSLLRTAIRADLRIFTKPYGPPPERDTSAEARAKRARGRAFLVDCPVDLGKRPWRDAFPHGG